jgi:mannose-6-phosphate isomerase
VIGAGLVIFEIQQHSDTIFRVFDWNRPGLEGQTRELHVEQSLQPPVRFLQIKPGVVSR